MKLLIVDDQISSQFKLIEQLRTQLKLQSSDIRIANNGFEAISIAEQYELDLILMDLYMPVMNGLKATEIIVSKFNHIKVIIITGSDDKKLLEKSISVGAEGYLFKENVGTNLISTIHNVNNGYTVFPKHDLNDLNSICNSDIIIEPNESDKILKINNIIALDIINTWIYNAKKFDFNENIIYQLFNENSGDRQELINDLVKGDSSRCSLIQELELRFEFLVSKLLQTLKLSSTSLEKELNIITKQLDDWFYDEEITKGTQCYKSRLEANAQTLRIKSSEKIHEYIKNIFSKTSPAACLEHLESMEMLLKNDIGIYKNKLSQVSQREKSALKAFNILSNLVNNANKKELKQEDINALNRSVLFTYQARMQIEIYNHTIQIIQGMIRTLQFYIDDLILTIKLLQTIHEQLSIFEVDDSISFFIKQKFSVYQDSLKLLQEVESEVGYPINQWGVQGHLDSNLILNKIVDKISLTGIDILQNIEQELSF